MPIIVEESEQHVREFAEQVPQDVHNIIDEDALTLSLAEAPSLNLFPAADVQSNCPAHPGIEDCLCQSFVGDWNLSEPVVTALTGPEEPDYSKFENVCGCPRGNRDHTDQISHSGSLCMLGLIRHAHIAQRRDSCAIRSVARSRAQHAVCCFVTAASRTPTPWNQRITPRNRWERS